MEYHERIGNLHIHTTNSDGTARVEELARAAASARLDFLVVTDHNVYRPEIEGWYGDALILAGEEVHAPSNSHVNHLLVFDAGDDLAPWGENPQGLIDAVRERGGLSYIAHPVEHSGAFSGEPEIDWVRWDVQGYHGLEIWNYMSEFKSYTTELARAVLYSLWPRLAMTGPDPEALVKWDELLTRRPIYAIGGSDAHGTAYSLGPFRLRVFPYEHLFSAVNTHVLVTEPWSGSVTHDARLVYEALAVGRAFVGYDALAPTGGFTFSAIRGESSAVMGGSLKGRGPVRFQARVPKPARLRLILNGFCVAEGSGLELEYSGDAPGAYRLEAYRSYMTKSRTWILSNPIFVLDERAQSRIHSGRSST